MDDSILFWNEVALEANWVSHTNGKMEQTGPTLSSRALAIVHLAIYDAYAAIDTTAGPPYLEDLPSPPAGASARAAMAGAAHGTLSALFPSQRSFFDVKLAEAGGVLNPGHDFGRQVARAILEDRANDPGAGDAGYVPSFARRRHRIDPDNPMQGFHAPFYGAGSKSFAITERHEIDPPPFDNREYLRALRDSGRQESRRMTRWVVDTSPLIFLAKLDRTSAFAIQKVEQFQPFLPRSEGGSDAEACLGVELGESNG